MVAASRIASWYVQPVKSPAKKTEVKTVADPRDKALVFFVLGVAVGMLILDVVVR